VREPSRDRRRALRRRTGLAAHGTRRRYQRGCDCLPCRAANAAYVTRYRRDAVPSLHSRIDAGHAKKRVRQLKAEGFTDGMIAAALGVTQFNLRGTTVTRLTHLQLEALYQARVADTGTPVTNSAHPVDFDDRPPVEPADDDPREASRYFVRKDRDEESDRKREQEVTGRPVVIHSRAR